MILCSFIMPVHAVLQLEKNSWERRYMIAQQQHVNLISGCCSTGEMNANLSEAGVIAVELWGRVGLTTVVKHTHTHTLSHAGSSLQLTKVTSDLSCTAPKVLGGSSFNAVMWWLHPVQTQA